MEYQVRFRQMRQKKGEAKEMVRAMPDFIVYDNKRTNV